MPLTSELGREIEAKARTIVAPILRSSVMPREIDILSPRAQQYFRRTREASLLVRPEPDEEEQSWNAVGDDMRDMGELMRTHKADGPFVLGARPSLTDFFLAGSLQCARIVDEGVFQRIFKYPGFEDVYQACLPYMEKKD